MTTFADQHLTRNASVRAAGAAGVLLVFLCLWPDQQSIAVEPQAETVAMNGSGDIADDAAFWLHPHDPTKSVMLGTNKASGAAGGLYAFDVGGARWGATAQWNDSNWFVPGKIINEVDVRYGFSAGNQRVDIVSVANRTDQRVDFFRVDTNAKGDFTGMSNLGAVSTTNLGDDNPYGTALFSTPGGEKHFLFASSKNGNVAQWELSFNTGTGQIAGTQVWSADLTPGLNGEVEGIVIDDLRGAVYIAAEDQAIYRYGTLDGVVQDASRVTVDSITGNLTADIEGLTMYFASNGEGYLLASSQGSNDFHVYRRDFSANDANSYLGSFAIAAANGIDAVSSTDGISVINSNLGGAFDSGMFVAHDGSGNNPSNYKLVPWQNIAESFTPNLIIDTQWNPRAVPEPHASTHVWSTVATGTAWVLSARRAGKERLRGANPGTKSAPVGPWSFISCPPQMNL